MLSVRPRWPLPLSVGVACTLSNSVSGVGRRDLKVRRFPIHVVHKAQGRFHDQVLIVIHQIHSHGYLVLIIIHKIHGHGYPVLTIIHKIHGHCYLVLIIIHKIHGHGYPVLIINIIHNKPRPLLSRVDYYPQF